MVELEAVQLEAVDLDEGATRAATEFIGQFVIVRM
jgi:hypothetical protein